MRIQEICSSITDGSHNPPQGVTDSEYLMLSSKNIFDNNITFVDPRYLRKEDFEMEDRRTNIQAGDVLLTIVGTVGRCAVVPERAPKFTLQRSVAVLHPREDICSSRFLMYALQGKRSYIEGRAKGVAQKGIYLGEVANIEVPIPDKSTQTTIILRLDKIASIIQNRQQQLLSLDDLIKARFVEMFGDPDLNSVGWPIQALGDLLSVEPQNGLYKPQSDYVQDGTGTRILRIDAFYNGKVTDFSKLKRLNCTEMEKSRYLLKENDIVINRVNSLEYLGKCAWITGMIEPTVFESNMMRFHVDESRIDPCYVTKLLCSTFIYKQILNRAKKAVNQASINQGDVQSFTILVPPLELQKKFAAFVAQIDKSKSVIQKSLDETQLLFDSLMQKYFG